MFNKISGPERTCFTRLMHTVERNLNRSAANSINHIRTRQMSQLEKKISHVIIRNENTEKIKENIRNLQDPVLKY